MSHSMEFGFPQSMKSCNTCHAIGNLIEKMVASEPGAIFHKSYIVDADTLKSTPCGDFHEDAGGIGPKFSKIHNGYDAEIYVDAAGTKYSDAFKVKVDDTTSFDAATNKLTVKFHADEEIDVAGLAVTDIEPTLIIGLYGYNKNIT